MSPKSVENSKKLSVSIKTFGCQMNIYDSEVAEGLLKQEGFEILKLDEDASPKKKSPKWSQPAEFKADVVLMNTCSVREHAEDRVFGRLGLLAKAKKKNPNMVVGLLGCMVEEHRENLFKRFPHLDLMVGTRNIKELPALINQVRECREQVAKIKQDGISIEYSDQVQRKGKYHAWLPIMTGCNKVCTFCIVPITRGSEVSMPAREVYREASRLVEDGVKWITLLGQNVNSYDGSSSNVGANLRVRPESNGSNIQAFGRAQGPAPTAKNQISFPQLLDELCKIEGLERISFTTSHPQDATPELYEVIGRNPKISRRFHLPLQSGSDRILKRMKRLHTYEEYKTKIEKMREMIPDVVITTDIIAGFSGETDEDHNLTIKALKEIRYDDAYIYKYSLRPGTPAAKLPDDVPLEIKSKRNAELLEVQNEISAEIRSESIGSVFEVFAENQNYRQGSQVRGRTVDEKIVAFEGDSSLVGTFQKVRVDSIHNETLLGTLI